MNPRTMFSAKTVYVVVITALLGSVVGCSTPSERDSRRGRQYQKGIFAGTGRYVLDIVVWKNEDLSQKAVVVRPDGKISMPLIGEMTAGGLTSNQLAGQIASRLNRRTSLRSTQIVRSVRFFSNAPGRGRPPPTAARPAARCASSQPIAWTSRRLGRLVEQQQLRRLGR